LLTDLSIMADFCERWCKPIGSASAGCPNGTSCKAFTPSITYNGTAYGACH
jgi:hypothetical protein